MALFQRKKEKLHLVVCINQVDNLGEWNDKTNLPTKETQENIQSRTDDIIEKLSSGVFSVSKEQIEYYSALRAFRLHHVNAKITTHCKDGVVMQNSPVNFFDEEIAPNIPDAARAILKRERDKDVKEYEEKYSIEAAIAQMAEHLSKDEIKVIQKIWQDQQAKPVHVGILGKCGVGKSTTVNNLFRGELESTEKIVELDNNLVNTSRTGVGNSEAQYKHYRLPKGGKLTIVDLPGYGRELLEDESYKQIYLRELPKCDIIILIVQANSSDLADDQAMIKTLIEWKKAKLI